MGDERGERIAWTDDEDEQIIARPSKKRKVDARPKRTTPAVAKKGGMVGLKPRKNARRRQYSFDSEEEEDALMEMALPDYLKSRQSEWKEQQQKLGAAGLLIPPDYEDVEFSGDERLKDLRERPSLPKTKPPLPYEDIPLRYSAGIIPASIAQYLKPYQVDGAKWLHERFVYQEGGILGDDMGLGKTIQVIAFLTAAFGKTGDERDAKRMRKMRRMGDNRWYPRVLIVCPGSLMKNWQNELERWGWWHIYVYHGTLAEKAEALAAAERGRLEIMMTTYTTYRLNQTAINSISWDCVIADECHTIKEVRADITKAMNEVNALCRIGLSGTAIQNSYEELWTLLNWTSPGRLGPLSTWRHSICLPLKLGQSHDATIAQLSKARRIATGMVTNLLPKFLIRRTKALIANQLPKKSDRVVFCPLTETQADAYNNFCDHPLLHAIRDAQLPCLCGSERTRGSCCETIVEGYGKWQSWVFPCLSTLQKLANHIALLLPSGEADPEKSEKDLQKLQIAIPDRWKELYEQRDHIATYANSEFCGKWRVLKKLLKLWHDNGDKVLVFSHSVRLLRMLKMLFTNTSYTVAYLDGSMTYDERQTAVDDYNADPDAFVFLISTRSGGVGLNITSANKVVVVDPNWNPSYDLQAQDRAYRIGQTRDVEVFRLVSVGTVEEIVYARQIYKQQQANIGYNASVERRYFRGVQDQKDKKGEIFGLINLLAPQSANVVLRDIVNQTNVAETRAGVEIAGLDLEASQDDDGDDGDGFGPLSKDNAKRDAAMSQLAAEIIDEPEARRAAAKLTAKKRDPVQAILAAAGVEYTHENAEVIGTSKIEMQISNRAQKAGNEVELVNELAFARHTKQRDASPGLQVQDMTSDEDASDLDSTVRYKYRPPEDIRKRQFCTMAQHFGYDDVTEFALVVEGWTQAQRRNCLEQFYQRRREKLSAVSRA